MNTKIIAFLFIIIHCNSSYILSSPDYETKEDKTNLRKLDILQKQLEHLDQIETKLTLNENHMSETNMCFWAAVLSTAGAASSLFIKDDREIFSPKIFISNVIVGTASTFFYLTSSHHQRSTLRNITEEKKQTLQAISDVK
jgi:hypothetical protein